jgi:hypothetical protein
MADVKKKKPLAKRLAQASPGTVVLLMAGAVFTVGVLSNLIYGSSWSGRSYPQFVYEQKDLKEKKRKDGGAGVAYDKPLFGGELYQTSLRLQEASDLAIGSVLFAASGKNSEGASSIEEFVNGLPKNVDELLNGLSSNNLLPPGITLSNNKVLSSDRSILIVRYRVEPFGVEVVSMPRQEGKGPGLIVRLTDDAGGNVVKYYESMTEQGVQIPDPFLPEAKVIEKGWMPQALNGQIVSASQLKSAQDSLAKFAAESSKK